jgi:hypothetical protein
MKLSTTYTYKAIHRCGFYGIKSGEACTIISDAFEHLNALIDILMDKSYEQPFFSRADSFTVFHRSFLI